jgi:hypothetical protein
MSVIEYIIPLCPFERTLLKGIQSFYALPNLESTSGHWSETPNQEHMLFKKWRWGSAVRGHISSGLTGDDLADHHGILEDAYADTLHWLESEGGRSQARFRVQLLKENNPHFIQLLSDRAIEDVHFVPHSEDNPSWEILSAMQQLVGPSLMSGHESGLLRRDKYDIWKTARIFAISQERPDNTIQMLALLGSSTFDSRYRIQLKKTKDENDVIDGEIELIDKKLLSEQKPVGKHYSYRLKMVFSSF